jgi:HD domain-containing protein
MLREIAILDEILDVHRAEIGTDFTAYRNHTYRVANFCAAIASPDAGQLQKIAVATAFHDIGIWTDRTFDYLPPSIRTATAFLEATGRTQWTGEIAEMIREHHKVFPYRRDPRHLAEAFRRADWMDVSRGLLSFGVARAAIDEILAAWPNHGFHKRLVQLELAHLRAHPLHPLPMMRL